ncbi:MAG TPA: hypothetical protein VIK61_11930 [Acidimicrobiia bacterium]
MTTKPTFTVLAAALSAALLVAGCGGGSKSSKADFCRDNATLNAKSAKMTSRADTVKFFEENIATIDHFGKVAPADIATDAKKMVRAAHDVISKKSAAPFENGSIATSARTVDKYCGPPASTTTT